MKDFNKFKEEYIKALNLADTDYDKTILELKKYNINMQIKTLEKIKSGKYNPTLEQLFYLMKILDIQILLTKN